MPKIIHINKERIKEIANMETCIVLDGEYEIAIGYNHGRNVTITDLTGDEEKHSLKRVLFHWVENENSHKSDE